MGIQFKAQIGDKTLTFSSAMARVKFFEHAGKHVIITIDDKPTSAMRRFFEGAVVPYIFYQNDTAEWETFADAREAVLQEFLPRWVQSLSGTRLRSRRSTTELSKAKFTDLLERVLRWMQENGYEVPDSEDFVAWRDSAPTAGSIYPPLKRLIETHKKH